MGYKFTTKFLMVDVIEELFQNWYGTITPTTGNMIYPSEQDVQLWKEYYPHGNTFKKDNIDESIILPWEYNYHEESKQFWFFTPPYSSFDPDIPSVSFGEIPSIVIEKTAKECVSCGNENIREMQPGTDECMNCWV